MRIVLLYGDVEREPEEKRKEEEDGKSLTEQKSDGNSDRYNSMRQFLRPDSKQRSEEG